MGLTARQKLFVKNYLVHGNASVAAAEAGYSKKTAGVQGYDLLTRPQIAKAVADGLTRVTKKAELKASDVLAEIRKIAFVDLSHAYAPDGSLMHPQDMPADLRAALASVETDEIFLRRQKKNVKVGVTRKIRLADKIRALEMLAKHFKLLHEMVEHSTDGQPLVVLTMPANGSEAPLAPVTPKDPVDGSDPA